MATATLAATDLRAELKEWERAFSAANGGRKAGRHDIKNNPDIAAKYKAYGRMKALESAADKDKHHDQNESTLEERPKKRKHTSPTGPGHEQSNAATPRKSNKGIFATPSRPRVNHPADLDPYDSPSVLRRLFSPSTHQQSTPLKAAVGPTPQRDGKALGLFDLLSESGGSTATPSATRIASLQGAAVQTPSRRNRMETIAEEDEEEEEENPRGGRTPASSGKKLYLENLFATPTTMKYAAMVEDEEDRKPLTANVYAASEAAASANRKAAGPGETPSFLRRSNAGRSSNGIDPSTGGLSPIAARKPPQFVGKGLSALVQGLRDMEEERMEDDMDVLREMEAEQGAMDNNEIDMEDSQAGDGASRKPYKKKGQKRSTRRVRMKPVVVPKAQTKSTEPSGDDEEENEQAAIPETQFQGQSENHFSEDDDADDASLHSISEPELEDSDPDFDEPVTKTKSFAEKMKEAISAGSKNNPQESSQSSELAKAKAKQKEKAKKDKEKEESAKPRPRKVNPEAHANYRSLKIRNKNTKGRGAGRFRR
ncbi:protein sld2 [Aspergillus chevalieri]|uniref:DNA replication regulator SLD2 n=1 Tax=Aspergillus chevalieri TaxID=182096 RepID=A0A7R7ZMU0_ASPCH|nr:DNA replication regulator sld2 [Aspergillus chevalieri]BCR87858.1 DNA replication regulator sld2 [Aspergillus chevalieri]